MSVPKKNRGRPRSFDEGEVLDRAMQVFWRRGYAETSVADLVAATGLERASLYAAFGDKQGLYLAVLTRYTARMMGLFDASLTAGDPAARLTEFYRAAIAVYSDDSVPRGCLLSNTAGVAAAELPAVRSFLEDALTEADTALTAFLREHGFSQPETRAALAHAVMHSAALRLRAGTPREEVEAFTRHAVPFILG
ncbi:TetR/AcrR family transcriptional regulator [Pseudooceanicola sp. C21-150M6]|uniref:TetR/AcrR family transcriptional regulator n=1 Tax=Pseudooceanicola sp. C21-150M6 TaxID=3434355 RepID=UPI003D7F7BEA